MILSAASLFLVIENNGSVVLLPIRYSRCVLAVFLPRVPRVTGTYPVKFTNRTKLAPVSANWYCAFMRSSPRTIARRIVDHAFGQA